MGSTVLLPFDETSSAAARRFVRAFAVEHCLEVSTGEGCLIASELVTNAILHGAAPVQLTLECGDDELTIEVADSDPRLDEVRIPAVDRAQPGGRGLRVVASLAKRWGLRPGRSGKTVWATVSTAST